MTASVCARCEAIVTTDNRMPTTPTKIPTRRVLGSAACSGVTSSSGMTCKNPQIIQKIHRNHRIWGADPHQRVLAVESIPCCALTSTLVSHASLEQIYVG